MKMNIKIIDFERSYLTKDQRNKVQEWLKTRSKPEIYIEEDCCGAKDYHYEIMPTGIGDNVVCVCGKDRLWIDMGN